MSIKTCSFCGRKSNKFNPIIGVDEKSVYICANCNNNFYNFLNKNLVSILQNIQNEKSLNGENSKEESNDYNLSLNGDKISAVEQTTDIINEEIVPTDIKDYLDKYVIKQDEAKKTLAIAMYQHYKRIELNNSKSDENIILEKSNVILIGPSGSGKTLLMKTLAKKMDLPLLIADATSLTQAGYVGEDVENILIRLLEKADNNLEKAQHGIIFIDEIDKIARKNSNSLDIGGEGVQQALLKIIEGAEISIKIKEEANNNPLMHQEQKPKTINTENILFVCSGSFPKLEEIIADRVIKKSGMGFNANNKTKEEQEKEKDNLLSMVEHTDLIKYGLIPEFVGRIPNITTLHKLNSKDIKKIIFETENSLYKQYEALFKTEKIKLELSDTYIDGIIAKLEKSDIGARGIKSIIEKDLKDYIYNIKNYVNETIKL